MSTLVFEHILGLFVLQCLPEKKTEPAVEGAEKKLEKKLLKN